MMRHIRRAALMFAASLAVIGSPVAAQDVSDTNGTTDFRNPPILDNGTYRDTIVTGETVWYAVVYTNNDPYRFEVSLPGADAAAAEELDLVVEFVGPTLGSIDSGDVLEGSASYNGGDTNVWYLVVTLSTDGQLGVPYELQLGIDGVQGTGFETCDEIPDCNLDEELAALDSQLVDLEAQLAALPEQNSDVDVEDRIAELEDDVAALREELAAAETRASEASTALQESEAEIAELCGSEPDCETVESSGSGLPAWALVVAGLVLVGGVGALVVSLRGRS